MWTPKPNRVLHNVLFLQLHDVASNTGVGEVQPAETFYPAHRVVLKQAYHISLYQFLVFVLYLLKTMARRAQNIFETARGQKKLPSPDLTGRLRS